MNEEETSQLVDSTLKRIVRYDPTAFLKLAGISVSGKSVRFEDASVIQKEFRGDQICILADESRNDIGGVYFEYQMAPKQLDVVNWIAKWAGLISRFPFPVALLVIYLHKGSYATFHRELSARVGVLETKATFDVLLLWESLDVIRTGAIPALIPLMTLCEDNPSLATFREEIDLIQRAELSIEDREELITFAFLIARRDMNRELLLPIVKEIYPMNRLPDIFEEAFDEVLKDRDAKNEAKGKADEARSILLMLCERRLGAPKQSVIVQLEAISNIDALHALIRDFERYENWDEMLKQPE